MVNEGDFTRKKSRGKEFSLNFETSNLRWKNFFCKVKGLCLLAIQITTQKHSLSEENMSSKIR